MNDSNDSTRTYPLVSVLMPVRNEGDFLSESLGAILSQDYPSDRVEIFVIDGMSTDGTRDIVRSFQSKHANVVLMNNPGKIVAKGMNLAIPRAHGEIIIRIDGHCTIAPDYIRRCVYHLQQGGVGGVGGAVNTVGHSTAARVIAAAMSSSFGVGGAAFRTTTDRTMLADTVPFPAYTQEIIAQAGPYDEELVRNQDDEYNHRLRKLGAKLLLAADVRSDYYSRSTFCSLWRQYYQYGYWKVRVMQKHPLQMKPRHFVPALCVLGVLILATGSILSGMPWVGLLLLAAGIYMVTSLFAAIRISLVKGMALLPGLPLAFAILHASYGVGFLVGIVKFANRWNDRT